MFINTPESLKKKAAIIRKFMQAKYGIDISQGHSLDVISRIFDFKDWNTASAALKAKAQRYASSSQIDTVGDLKKALQGYEDSAWIEADYRFKVKELAEYENNDPEDEMYQEFSFTVEEQANDIVILNLELVHESGPPPRLDWEFFGTKAPIKS